AVEAGLGWGWGASTRPAAAAGLALLPLEMAFAAGVAVRNHRYDAGRLPIRSAEVPVVSVGNLAVGGSGKTPLAAWLAAWFLRRGVTPGIVTNGYGLDEMLLHRQWNPEAPVAADGHRARAAAVVVERGAQVVILDDGFQHRALARDLDLVLVAAEHPVPLRLLPRGPYREPEKALTRAGGVIVTRRVASFGAARRRARALEAVHRRRCALVSLAFSRWSDVAGAPASAPTGSALVLSGIARPWEFHGLLQREIPGMELEPMIFSDHHCYSAADMAAIARRARGRPVVTTAKDAVKLPQLSEHGVDARVLHLEVVVERGRRWLEDALGELPGIAGLTKPTVPPSLAGGSAR
ncbi:MAG: tetraacyldisaccharide 4'-kinase, partial [Gammaproteobacteria bacterium]|nr:tetraacyldisaccharide 4'-kinase [Gammaproteobacteria bacterium]